MCLFGQRPDHQTDAVDGEITPLGRATHLDVVGRHDFDYSGRFEDGLAAAECHLFTGRLELGQPGLEGVGCRFSRVPALSGRDEADHNRIESGVEELGRRLETEVVGSNRDQFPDPFFSEAAQSDSLPLMHGGGGDVAKESLAPSLQLHQTLDLLGFASEVGGYPASELLGEAFELLGSPCHSFRVLVISCGRDRKVRGLVSGMGQWEA